MFSRKGLSHRSLAVLLSSQELWAFILRLNESVTNKKRSSVRRSDASPGVCKMLEVLETLGSWVDAIDRIDTSTPGRFGNKAFRIWHSKLNDRAAMLMEPVVESMLDSSHLSDHKTTAAELATELGDYLATSFGNETRIDYGSGHEASFLILLFCLWKVGVFAEEDDEHLVLLVFPAYLKVTRNLQLKYTLEPAGSHGVWGLDDYSFLPFLWGSAQLLGRNTTRVQPTDVMNEEVIREYRDEYLYVDAIGAIAAVKTGPFFEHSPMLNDISRVKAGWPKINQGMIKMYRGEVWSKRQVVQHLLFGSVFRYEPRQLWERPPPVASAEGSRSDAAE